MYLKKILWRQDQQTNPNPHLSINCLHFKDCSIPTETVKLEHCILRVWWNGELQDAMLLCIYGMSFVDYTEGGAQQMTSSH